MYIPYAYAYPVVVEPEPEVAEEPGYEQEPPALTVFEHRPRMAPSATARAETAPPSYESEQPQAAPSKPEVRDELPILLIYRDGHRREVKNYAIVGHTLYDLGMFVAQKIPLDELDLKATVKTNEDRGVEFSLPAGITP